jgi:hypothetical protein
MKFLVWVYLRTHSGAEPVAMHMAELENKRVLYTALLHIAYDSFMQTPAGSGSDIGTFALGKLGSAGVGSAGAGRAQTLEFVVSAYAPLLETICWLFYSPVHQKDPLQVSATAVSCKCVSKVEGGVRTSKAEAGVHIQGGGGSLYKRRRGVGI